MQHNLIPPHGGYRNLKSYQTAGLASMKTGLAFVFKFEYNCIQH